MKPIAVALALISVPASAQWQTVFLSTQLGSESSKLSTSLAEADRTAAREKRKRDEPVDLIPECQTHADCEGYCISGRCVEAVEEQENARTEPTQVSEPPLTPPSVARCSAAVQCAEGLTCLNGFCMSPPPPPSSAVQRRALEFYVRQNVVQLREDLALGEGPTIATLALFRGGDAKTLGRAMRRHRDELVRTLGDRGDVEWPGRFLAQLNSISPRTLISLNTSQP